MSDELAKRAVACKAWRWMPWMLNKAGIRIVQVDEDGYMLGIPDKYRGWTTFRVVDIFCPPDLSDPTTIGCLLHLVRQHWGDGGAHTKRFCRYGGGEKWLCYAPSVFYPTLQTDGESEAEALVKALEMEIPND